jgi:hypothetical protein
MEKVAKLEVPDVLFLMELLVLKSTELIVEFQIEHTVYD